MKIPIAFIALATLCGQVAALVKITSYLTANCDGPSVSQVFDQSAEFILLPPRRGLIPVFPSSYPGHELKMAVGAGSANGARGWRVWFDNCELPIRLRCRTSEV